MLAAALLSAALLAPQESWTLTGHITTRDGDLLVEGWEVRCTAMKGRSNVRRLDPVPVDPKTGTFTFEIEDSPRAFVSAHHTATGISIQAVQCEPIDGAATVTLFHDGHPPSALATVVLESPWLDSGLALGTRSLKLAGSLGDRPALRRDRSATGQRWIAPLGRSSEYALDVLDPRFERIEGVAIRGGAETRVALRGAASVELEILDAAGERIRNVDVTAQRAFGDGGVASARLAERAVPLRRGPLGGLALGGLVPGDLTLRIAAAGHAAAEVRVLGVTRNEVQRVEVQLEREACLRGRIVQPEDTPPFEAFPMVFALPVDTDLGGVAWREKGGVPVPEHPGLLRTMPSKDGAFSIEGAAPGRYRIWCAPTPWAHVEALGGDAPVELALPKTGRLVCALPPEETAWVVRRYRDPVHLRAAMSKERFVNVGNGQTQLYSFSYSTAGYASGRSWLQWTGAAPGASPVDGSFLAYAMVPLNGRVEIEGIPEGYVELELAPAPSSSRLRRPVVLGAPSQLLGEVRIRADRTTSVEQKDGALEVIDED